MAQKKASHVLVCKELKPHLLMVLVQVGYTFLYFITEASFNHGMSPYVYVTYRHIVAAVVMFPFAYFLERYTCINFSSRVGIPLHDSLFCAMHQLDLI